MGVDPISLAIIATTAVVGVKQSQLAQESARADSKARRTQNNKEEYQQLQDTRQRVRQRRLKAAQLAQSSEQGGTVGSSGELGGFAQLAAETNAQVSNAKFESEANKTISGFKQDAADAQTKSAEIGAKGKIISNIFSGYGNIY